MGKQRKFDMEAECDLFGTAPSWDTFSISSNEAEKVYVDSIFVISTTSEVTLSEAPQFTFTRLVIHIVAIPLEMNTYNTISE